MRTLEKLILSVPPLSEQQSIADYLDQKCSEIDELISIKQQKIEKLKDYKKSLIFECVTGKRKVSESQSAKEKESKSQNGTLDGTLN